MSKHPNMRHVLNEDLPKGRYRIVCTNCGKVILEKEGNLTKAALASMVQPQKCGICNGEIILETNPKAEHNRYNENHPYPDFPLE